MKSTVAEMKHLFNGFSNGVAMTKERICVLQDFSRETSKTEKQREIKKKKKSLKNKNGKSKNCGTATKCITYI